MNFQNLIDRIFDTLRSRAEIIDGRGFVYIERDPIYDHPIEALQARNDADFTLKILTDEELIDNILFSGPGRQSDPIFDDMCHQADTPELKRIMTEKYLDNSFQFDNYVDIVVEWFTERYIRYPISVTF